jgi:hypothetical protein
MRESERHAWQFLPYEPPDIALDDTAISTMNRDRARVRE